MKKELSALIIGFIALASTAGATTLNFEDLYPAEIGEYLGILMPNSYQGFAMGMTDEDGNNQAAWVAASVNENEFGFGHVAMFNKFSLQVSMTSSSLFTLNDGWIATRSEEETQVSITGWNGSTIVYNETFGVSFFTPTFVSFNWTGIDKVVFGNGEQHFLVDDLRINDPVPEPATALLFGAGLVGLTAVSRKKRG